MTDKDHSRFWGRGVWHNAPSVYPKFTDQVQHFFSKVLRWDDSMNNFRLKTAVEFPVLAKPGKQSAKSRQLWIARHRLSRESLNATAVASSVISRLMPSSRRRADVGGEADCCVIPPFRPKCLKD